MKKLIAATLIAGSALVAFPAAAGASSVFGVETPTCPDGSDGVIIGSGGTQVAACTDAAPEYSIGFCSNGDTGVVVTVNGVPTFACVDTPPLFALTLDDFIAKPATP